MLKVKFSLSSKGPFKILAVGPVVAADTPDGCPLASKSLYLGIPPDARGPDACNRSCVMRCKSSRTLTTPQHPDPLPAEQYTYVFHFGTKSPPFICLNGQYLSPHRTFLSGQHLWAPARSRAWRISGPWRVSGCVIPDALGWPSYLVLGARDRYGAFSEAHPALLNVKGLSTTPGRPPIPCFALARSSPRVRVFRWGTIPGAP